MFNIYLKYLKIIAINSKFFLVEMLHRYFLEVQVQ